jgi:hypothetical protein
MLSNLVSNLLLLWILRLISHFGVGVGLEVPRDKDLMYIARRGYRVCPQFAFIATIHFNRLLGWL